MCRDVVVGSILIFQLLLFTVRQCHAICGIIVQLLGKWWIMIFHVDGTCVVLSVVDLDLFSLVFVM